MLEQRCVYCSPLQPASERYTDEHVIPEAFGKFKNNLVLNQGVCDGCNQFFANNLDLILGRGSVEAIRRLDFRIKPPDEADDILRNRISYTLSTGDQFDGLKVELGSEQGELVILLLPQVGFQRINGNGYVYLTERELADVSKPLPKDIDTKSQVYLVYNTDEIEQRFEQLLRARNIKPQETTKVIDLPIQRGQEVTVAVKAKLDDMIFRTISKIAFNYLVKIQGIDFAVKSNFDPIRRYIRYGEKTGYTIVDANRKPILEYDQVRYRQTNGHIITLSWSKDGRHLIGQVSLFNFVTYNVILARNYSGVLMPIRSGHLFSIETMEVQPLLGASSQLLG
jgi:hypothetical protein